MGGIGSGAHCSKAIEQLDYLTGEVIREYKTITDAALDNYTEHCTLSYALKHRNGVMKRKNLRFRYKRLQF